MINSAARKTLRFVWQAYVLLCITVVSLYIGLMCTFLVGIRFDAVQLPNGAYMNHRKFIPARYSDIVLRRAVGDILVNESIDFVCFNNAFVFGYTMSPFRSFVYEKGQDSAVYGGDARFDDIYDRSDLYAQYSGCNGHLRAMTGFGILLKDPKYRR